MEESTRLRMIEEKIGLLLKTFECPICLELMKNPVSTKCDHKFCRHCIYETIGHKTNSPCPICKVPFTKRSLSTLTDWNHIVKTVGGLVEAFEQDTGTPFSPPRGASIPLSQESTSANYNFVADRQEEEETDEVILGTNVQNPELDRLPKDDKENIDRKVRRRSSKRRKDSDPDRDNAAMDMAEMDQNRGFPVPSERGESSSLKGKRRRVTTKGKSTFPSDLDPGGGGDNAHSLLASNRIQEVQGIVGRRGTRIDSGGGGDVMCVYNHLEETGNSLDRQMEGGKWQNSREKDVESHKGNTNRNINGIEKEREGDTGRSRCRRRVNVRITGKRGERLEVEGWRAEQTGRNGKEGGIVQERVVDEIGKQGERDERMNGNGGEMNENDGEMNGKDAKKNWVDGKMKENDRKSNEKDDKKNGVDGEINGNTGKLNEKETELDKRLNIKNNKGLEGRKSRSQKASNVRMAPKKKVDMTEFDLDLETQSSETINRQDSVPMATDEPLGTERTPEKSIPKGRDYKKRPKSWDQVTKKYPLRHSRTPDSMKSPDVFQGELLIKTYGPEKVNIKCLSRETTEELRSTGKRMTRSQSANNVQYLQESMHLFTQSEEIEDRKKQRIKGNKLRKETEDWDKQKEVMEKTNKTVVVKYEGNRNKSSKISKINQTVGSRKGYVSDFDKTPKKVSIRKSLPKEMERNVSVVVEKLIDSSGALVKNTNDKIDGETDRTLNANLEDMDTNRECKEPDKICLDSKVKKKDDVMMAGDLNVTTNQKNRLRTRGQSSERDRMGDKQRGSAYKLDTGKNKDRVLQRPIDSGMSSDEIEVIPETNVYETIKLANKSKENAKNEVSKGGRAINVHEEKVEPLTRFGKVESGNVKNQVSSGGNSGKQGGQQEDKEGEDEEKTKHVEYFENEATFVDKNVLNQLTKSRKADSLSNKRSKVELEDIEHKVAMIHAEKNLGEKFKEFVTAGMHPEDMSQEGRDHKVDRWLDVMPDSVSPLLSVEAMNAKFCVNEDLKRMHGLEAASQECMVGDHMTGYQGGVSSGSESQKQQGGRGRAVDREKEGQGHSRDMGNMGKETAGKCEEVICEEIGIVKQIEEISDNVKSEKLTQGKGRCLDQEVLNETTSKEHSRRLSSSEKCEAFKQRNNESLDKKKENHGKVVITNDDIENVIPPSIMENKKTLSRHKHSEHAVTVKRVLKDAQSKLIIQDSSENQVSDRKSTRKIFKSRDTNLVNTQEHDKPQKGQLPVAFVHSSPECRDPYAFKMSQRTPIKKGTKLKKGLQGRKNRKAPLKMLNDNNRTCQLPKSIGKETNINLAKEIPGGNRKEYDRDVLGTEKAEEFEPVAVEIGLHETSEKMKRKHKGDNKDCTDVIEIPETNVAIEEVTRDREGIDNSTETGRKEKQSRKSRSKSRGKGKSNKKKVEYVEVNEEEVAQSTASSQLFEDIESTCSEKSRPQKRSKPRKKIVIQDESLTNENTESHSVEDQKWFDHFKEVEEEEFVFSSSDERLKDSTQRMNTKDKPRALNVLEEGGQGHLEKGGVDAEDLQRAIDQVRKEQDHHSESYELEVMDQGHDLEARAQERCSTESQVSEGVQAAKIFTEAGPLSVQLIQRGSQIEVVGGGSQVELFHSQESQVEAEEPQGNNEKTIPVRNQDATLSQGESQVELFGSTSRRDNGIVNEKSEDQSKTEGNCSKKIESEADNEINEGSCDDLYEDNDLATNQSEIQYGRSGVVCQNNPGLHRVNLENVSDIDLANKVVISVVKRGEVSVENGKGGKLVERRRRNDNKKRIKKQDVQREWASMRNMRKEIGPRRARKLRLKHDSKRQNQELQHRKYQYRGRVKVEPVSGDSDTDSLEIEEEEQMSYERPDLDIQPEELKKRLSQASVEMRSVVESGVVKLVPESVLPSTSRVTTVMETPLIPLSRTPNFTNVQKEGRSNVKKSPEMVVNRTGSRSVSQEVMAENPVSKSPNFTSVQNEGRSNVKKGSEMLINQTGSRINAQEVMDTRTEEKCFDKSESNEENSESQKLKREVGQVNMSGYGKMSEISVNLNSHDKSMFQKKETDETLKKTTNLNRMRNTSNEVTIPSQVNSSDSTVSRMSTKLSGKVSGKLKETKANSDQLFNNSSASDISIPVEDNSIMCEEPCPLQISDKSRTQKRRSSELSATEDRTPPGGTSVQNTKTRRKRLKRKTFSLSGEKHSPEKTNFSEEHQSLDLDQVISQVAGSVVMSHKGAKVQSNEETVVRNSAISQPKIEVQSLGRNVEGNSSVSQKDTITSCDKRGNNRSTPSQKEAKVQSSMEISKVTKVQPSISQEMFSDNRSCTLNNTEDVGQSTEESVSMLQPVVCIQRINVNNGNNGLGNNLCKSKPGTQRDMCVDSNNQTGLVEDNIDLEADSESGGKKVLNSEKDVRKPKEDCHVISSETGTQESVSMLQPVVCLQKEDINDGGYCTNATSMSPKQTLTEGNAATDNTIGQICTKSGNKKSENINKSSSIKTEFDLQMSSASHFGENNIDIETCGEQETFTETVKQGLASFNGEGLTSNQDLYSSDEEDVLIHRPSDESSQRSSQESEKSDLEKELTDDEYQKTEVCLIDEEIDENDKNVANENKVAMVSIEINDLGDPDVIAETLESDVVLVDENIIEDDSNANLKHFQNGSHGSVGKLSNSSKGKATERSHDRKSKDTNIRKSRAMVLSSDEEIDDSENKNNSEKSPSFQRNHLIESDGESISGRNCSAHEYANDYANELLDDNEECIGTEADMFETDPGEQMGKLTGSVSQRNVNNENEQISDIISDERNGKTTSSSQSLNIVDITTDQLKHGIHLQRNKNMDKDEIENSSKNEDHREDSNTVKGQIESLSKSGIGIERMEDYDIVLDKTKSIDRASKEQLDIDTCSSPDEKKKCSKSEVSITTVPTLPKDTNSYFRSSTVRDALLRQNVTSPSIGSFPSAKKLKLKVDASPLVMSAPVMHTLSPEAKIPAKRTESDCKNFCERYKEAVDKVISGFGDDSDSEDLPDIDFGNKSISLSCDSDVETEVKESNLDNEGTKATVEGQFEESKERQSHKEKLEEIVVKDPKVNVQGGHIKTKVITSERVKIVEKKVEKNCIESIKSDKNKPESLEMMDIGQMSVNKMDKIDKDRCETKTIPESLQTPPLSPECYLIRDKNERSLSSSGEYVIQETPMPDKDILLKEEIEGGTFPTIDEDMLNLDKKKASGVEGFSEQTRVSPSPGIQPHKTQIPHSQDEELTVEMKAGTPSTLGSTSERDSDCETDGAGNSSSGKDMNLTSSSGVSSDINQSQAKAHIEADIGELQEQIRALEALQAKNCGVKNNLQSIADSETMDTFDPKADVTFDDRTSLKSVENEGQGQMEQSGYESDEDLFGPSQPQKSEVKVKGQGHKFTGTPASGREVVMATIMSPRSPSPPPEDVEYMDDGSEKPLSGREKKRRFKGKGQIVEEDSINESNNKSSEEVSVSKKGKISKKKENGVKCRKKGLVVELSDDNMDEPVDNECIGEGSDRSSTGVKNKKVVKKGKKKSTNNMKMSIDGDGDLVDKLTNASPSVISLGVQQKTDNEFSNGANSVVDSVENAEEACNEQFSERSGGSGEKRTILTKGKRQLPDDHQIKAESNKKRRGKNVSKKGKNKSGEDNNREEAQTIEDDGDRIIISGVTRLDYTESCSTLDDDIDTIPESGDMVPVSGDTVPENGELVPEDENFDGNGRTLKSNENTCNAIPDMSCDMYSETSVISSRNPENLADEKKKNKYDRKELDSAESLVSVKKTKHDRIQENSENKSVGPVMDRVVKNKPSGTDTDSIQESSDNIKRENIGQGTELGTTVGTYKGTAKPTAKGTSKGTEQGTKQGTTLDTSIGSEQGTTQDTAIGTTQGTSSTSIEYTSDWKRGNPQKRGLRENLTGKTAGLGSNLTTQSQGPSVGNSSPQDIFNEESESESSPKTVAFPRKPHWKLTASGINKVMDKPYIQKLCQLLGCQLVHRFDSTVTHVLVKPVDGFPLVCPRTLKYFQGIASKVWVLSVQWAVQSIKQKRLLPEADFEIVGDSVYRDKLHRAPARARTSSQMLLKNYEVCCHGEFDLLQASELRTLAELCGASTTQDPQLFTLSRGSRQVVLVEHKYAADMLELPRIRRVYNIPIVKKEWLLDSVGEYEVKDLEPYLIN